MKQITIRIIPLWNVMFTKLTNRKLITNAAQPRNNGFFIAVKLMFILCYYLFVMLIFVSLLYRFTIDEVQGVQNTKGYEIQMETDGYSCKEKVHHDFIHLINEYIRNNK